MNKHLGHLLVVAAFVGLGNGLGGSPGGGGAAGSVGGPSNAGAGGSPSDPSRSVLEGSGSPPALKNASLGLGPSSGGGGGGVGGSSGGSEGLGGHPPSGGSRLAGGVSTPGSSSGVSGSSGSTTSPSSAISGPRLDLTGGFGAGHGGSDVPGGAASDFGGLGSGSIFDNLNSGFDPSSGEAAAGAEGRAGGAGGFSGDQFSGRDRGFDSEFRQSWGSHRSPESSLLTRGSFTGDSGFGEGPPGGLGAWGSGVNFNRGEGAPGGGTHGFGVFSRESEFGNFDSGSSAFGLPEGTGGGLGADGIGSRGGAGAFPPPLAEPETGDIFGPESGHGGSFPSSSGFIGSPVGERSTDIDISNPDGSDNPSSSLAHALGGFQRTRLLSRLWQSGRTGRGQFGLGHRRKKADPRLAAAIALGTLAGVAALGSIGAGIAASIHNRRRNGVVGIGRARRGCVSGDCHRMRRSIPMSKVPAETLDGIPMNFERL